MDNRHTNAGEPYFAKIIIGGKEMLDQLDKIQEEQWAQFATTNTVSYMKLVEIASAWVLKDIYDAIGGPAYSSKLGQQSYKDQSHF